MPPQRHHTSKAATLKNMFSTATPHVGSMDGPPLRYTLSTDTSTANRAERSILRHKVELCMLLQKQICSEKSSSPIVWGTHFSLMTTYFRHRHTQHPNKVLPHTGCLRPKSSETGCQVKLISLKDVSIFWEQVGGFGHIVQYKSAILTHQGQA